MPNKDGIAAELSTIIPEYNDEFRMINEESCIRSSLTIPSAGPPSSTARPRYSSFEIQPPRFHRRQSPPLCDLTGLLFRQRPLFVIYTMNFVITCNDVYRSTSRRSFSAASSRYFPQFLDFPLNTREEMLKSPPDFPRSVVEKPGTLGKSGNRISSRWHGERFYARRGCR